MEFHLSYFKSSKTMLLSVALNLAPNLEISTATTGLEKVSFHSNPKCSKYCTTAFISLVSKVMLKILPKAFDCVHDNKLWKILKDMGILDHLTYFLRNLYAGQEATVRTRHGTMDQLQIGERVHQGCILSPCLFNLYAEYIMRNAGLDEAEAGIKTAGRNVNNLRHVDDTSLMAESKEELKSLWMKVKEESEKLA